MRPFIIPFFIVFQGCSFRCIYCAQDKITASQSRLPSSVEIQDKITHYLKTKKEGKYTHHEVAFYGGTFTGLSIQDQKKLLEAVFPFIKKGLIQNVRASTKPDLVDEPQLDPLLRLGLSILELGVQSLDDEILKRTGRGYRRDQVFKTTALLKRKGFCVGLQLMPGLPGGDEKEAVDTLKKALSLKPDFIRIYPTVIIKNTGLAHLYLKGKYEPWSLERSVRLCKQLKKVSEEAGVKVIKMGLEFSSDERKEILAGPYHPHFHQLVEGGMHV